MVCRTTSIGSAVTSYARLCSGLEDQQCLSTFHSLMREGTNRPNPTPQEQQQLLDRLAASVSADQNLTPARRQSILNRLEAAQRTPMDGRLYYAANESVERTQTASTALADYRANAARDLGLTEAEVATRIREAAAVATEHRQYRAPTEWVNAFQNTPEGQHMPLDRATAYAVNLIETQRTAARAAQPTRPVVTRRQIRRSSSVQEAGYDIGTGRLEVVMRSNPERVYSYQVPANVAAEMLSADSVGSYFTRNIRNNPTYRYASQHEADAAGTRTQCGSCGQFAGPSHACPPRGSVAEVNQTRRRARAAATDTPVTNEPPRMIGGQTYQIRGGNIQMPAASAVRMHAMEHRELSVPIGRNFTTADNGAVVESVSGRVLVANGEDGELVVTPVNAVGDSGQDNLRCTCQQYRTNHHCPHIDRAVREVYQRINTPALVTRTRRLQAQQAVDTVNAELAQDRAESIAAQQTAAVEWPESPVSYTEDHAAFQREYRAAKRRAAGGEAPIPYMTENATAGLGARNGGRAFGTEIEFEFPREMTMEQRRASLRQIGNELHEAGLTPDARQRGYGSTHGQYRENHAGGWSFEADPTVAGEIVSPAMYDEPETWNSLAKVCEIVRRNGGIPGSNAGAHVHISAHNYDHTVANHNRLLSMYQENEDLIYRLSANPETGRHRGRGYCSPNRDAGEGYRSVEDARSSNYGHHIGLNLQSVTGRNNDHIEFRTWDASLDPGTLQTQIKTSLALTEAAFRDTGYTRPSRSALGSRRRENRETFGSTRRLTGEAWQQDTAGFRALADRIFWRAEDKAQFTSLFAMTKWQRDRG